MSSSLARVGILVPSTDTMVEQELPHRLRDLASCHFARMSLKSVTEPDLRAMELEAEKEAAILSDMRPDILIFACTSGTFILGAEHEADLAARLARASGSAVVTTARAMVDALRNHGSRVRLRTPYDAQITQAEVTYLESFGLTATSSEALGLTLDHDIADVRPGDLENFVKGDDDADVVMLSCTNLRALDNYETLVARAGLPVVTSNLAAATAARRLLLSN
ncbi:MAG: arylmalonate decarboxylase [Microbacteriaceae bacterium]|jgi:maleate isomerase|nr:arylmalonate decarboxylase [Microbacteriaceae bacterium]